MLVPATWAKLDNGEWGFRLSGDAAANAPQGAILQILAVRRDGQESVHHVKVVWVGKDRDGQDMALCDSCGPERLPLSWDVGDSDRGSQQQWLSDVWHMNDYTGTTDLDFRALRGEVTCRLDTPGVAFYALIRNMATNRKFGQMLIPGGAFLMEAFPSADSAKEAAELVISCLAAGAEPKELKQKKNWSAHLAREWLAENSAA